MEEFNKVLIVDDNVSLAQLYQIVFERAGYHVSCVNSSLDALDLLEVTQPDIIVLDVRMPDIDGIKLCEMIRARPGRPRYILFYTADARREVEARCLAAGANAYLTKLSSALMLPKFLRSALVMA